MTAQVWLGTRTRTDYLRRLSVVFASELRLKIVTELYMQEMSPKQFFAEFGGGSPSRVNHNFRRLSEHGWLRLVRTESGGRRRGGVEHFFRATELAIFDYETWSLLPYSVRVAFSWKTLRQLEERLAGTLVSKRLERSGAGIACDQAMVDETGWRRVITAMDRTFIGLFDEQRDSRLRIHRSGGPEIDANVALFAFESAGNLRRGTAPRLAATKADSLVPFSLRISKVLADQLSLRILAEANRRDVSAPQLHAEIGGDSPSGIRRRFKMLEGLSWVQLTSSLSGGRRRGATEKFYRAAGPAVDDLLASASNRAHMAPVRDAFDRLFKLAREATLAGTFDARTDRYATWSTLRLDELGWERTTQAVADLENLVRREAEESERRLRRSTDAAIPVAVGLAIFEAHQPQQLY